ncbi:phage integrase family site-specific recombinase [Klebsiella oxytoca]|nr:hypothetical protein AI2744V1_3181 [Klebsiella oxytoca]CAH5260085.1 hypothetical protein AI2744V1_3181 [Klebsiella oxytoca]SBM39031.1 phage integrase family site-specific recombinase [Klebsiella oxytoca]
MLGLMQRTFRFCSNQGVINVNSIESLRRADVGLTAAVKERWLSDEEIKTVWNALPEMKHRQQLIGNDSNLLIVFYVQIMPDDFVMQLHRF